MQSIKELVCMPLLRACSLGVVCDLTITHPVPCRWDSSNNQCCVLVLPTIFIPADLLKPPYKTVLFMLMTLQQEYEDH